MRRSARFLARGYRCLLYLYPPAFRAEFAAEMDAVFEQALAAAAPRGRGAVARLCLRELGAWPLALGRQWADSVQTSLARWKGTIMEQEPMAHDPGATQAGNGRPDGGGQTAPWPHVLMGTLALLVPGLALVGWPGLPTWWHLGLILGAYLFVLVGLLAGWIQGFARWSYAFLGYTLIFALWLSSVSTPDLRLLGYTFGRHEVWGGRAWLGLAAVAVAALLWTRSLRPLGRFFTGIWRDWTCLSFALYGTSPFVIWTLFDEVHLPYRLPFLVVSALCLTGGALVFMRAPTPARRALSLLAGLSAAWLISTAALSAYWNGPRVPGLAPFTWWRTALPMAVAGVVALALLLTPAALGLLRRGMRALRAA